jgi:hypothetical protein
MGLMNTVPINIHLIFKGNIFSKILTPQNEANIWTHLINKVENISFQSIGISSQGLVNIKICDGPLSHTDILKGKAWLFVQ